VTLDTLGRLPTPDETAKFVADTTPDKRAKLMFCHRQRFIEQFGL